MSLDNQVVSKVKNTLIKAASSYSKDQIESFKSAIEKESVPRARWVLENLLENAKIAEENKGPLCDDTGIPHLLLEVGDNTTISSDLMDSINQGVIEGLRELPGRPMAVKGDSIQRLEQSVGLSEDSGDLEAAPMIIKRVDEDKTTLNILMQGGGPEIRSKTYRVFHQHKLSNIVDEILEWALEEVGKLGCTPTVPAIGIGRTHFEATSMMLEAMVYGDFSKQTDIEKEITNRINESNVGPLGLNGDITALATFLRVGPQRASGVRIVCLRLGCCVEPRIASVEL